jgi:hypothetical protein
MSNVIRMHISIIGTLIEHMGQYFTPPMRDMQVCDFFAKATASGYGVDATFPFEFVKLLVEVLEAILHVLAYLKCLDSHHTVSQ